MKYACLFFALIWLLTACATPAPETPPAPDPLKDALEAIMPRDSVTGGYASYYAPDASEARHTLSSAELAQVLNVLYDGAVRAQTAPPTDAADAALCLTLEAGALRAECLLYASGDATDIYVASGDERRLLYADVPGLRDALAAWEQYARVRYAYAPETEPPGIDPALRAALPEGALTAPLNGVSASHTEYTPQDKPFYRVLSPDDADIPLEEAQLLIVAAYGARATEGYAIRIDAVEASEQYSRVRVTITTPAEGDWLSRTPSSPVDSVIVDADAIPSDSVVIFCDQHGKLLYLQPW